MRIFSGSLLFKTIKFICINNAPNDGYIILEKNHVRDLKEKSTVYKVCLLNKDLCNKYNWGLYNRSGKGNRKQPDVACP